MIIPEINVEYIDEIRITEYEHVTIMLPDGRRVTVYADHVRVVSCKNVYDHVDGKKIWSKKDEPKQVHVPWTQAAGEVISGSCCRCEWCL